MGDRRHGTARRGGAPAGEAPIGEAPAGETPVGEAMIGEAPVGGAPIGGAPAGEAPIGEASIGEAPIGEAPAGGAPVGEASRGKRAKTRHWWRWIAGGAFALIVLAVAATGAVVTLSPVPSPLSLPKAAAAPSGSPDGTWRVTAGSVAGFRIRETVLGFGNDVTGRTGDVAGTMVLAGTQVTRAVFRVSLDAITVNGKARQPQLVRSLDTAAHPVATITLTSPVSLPATFSPGGPVTRAASAALTLNGTTRPVTVALSARRDGPKIEAAGSMPVSFADFGITGPRGYGPIGSLASSGTAEFLLLFSRS